MDFVFVIADSGAIRRFICFFDLSFDEIDHFLGRDVSVFVGFKEIFPILYEIRLAFFSQGEDEILAVQGIAVDIEGYGMRGVVPIIAQIFRVKLKESYFSRRQFLFYASPLLYFFVHFGFPSRAAQRMPPFPRLMTLDAFTVKTSTGPRSAHADGLVMARAIASEISMRAPDGETAS